MEDSIYKDWQQQLNDFKSKVEASQEEIRALKELIYNMQADAPITGAGRFIRDDQRIVLSAPEIVIGNVTMGGMLNPAGGSTIIIRGNDVALEGVGEAGKVETRAPLIHQIAENPGVDGCEHAVGELSEVVSQAHAITLQSEASAEAFLSPVTQAGVTISSDSSVDIQAAKRHKVLQEQLEAKIAEMNGRKSAFQSEVNAMHASFKASQEAIDKLLAEREKLATDDEGFRSDYESLDELNEQVEELTHNFTIDFYNYTNMLGKLAEANRLIASYQSQLDEEKSVDDEAYKNEITGASLRLVGEQISLDSVDGDYNIRKNNGAGIDLLTNSLSVSGPAEEDGTMPDNNKFMLSMRTVELNTVAKKDIKFDGGELASGQFAAEGDVVIRSKNITLESLDYEVADKKYKEKALSADGKISMRSKTIEVSTMNSANVEVDDKGQLTKANYTAEGDIIVQSKTVKVESADYDYADNKLTEKALTKDGVISLRAEKMDLSATDTEGKATGSLSLNAKAVAVKSMDVEKEKRTDDKLAAGSTMVLVAEKMYVGAKSKDVKSKKVQTVGEEVALIADKTLEAQQDKKAIVQLSGGNLSVGGSKTAVYGDTTINAKAEIKGEVKAPKATIDNLEAKSSFKSQNISDGIAVPGAGGGGSLSAKMEQEDAPKE